MKVMSINAVRANLYRLIDEIVDSAEPLIISRGDGAAVVVLPVNEWESLKQTIMDFSVTQPQRAPTKRWCDNCGQDLVLDSHEMWVAVTSGSRSCPTKDGPVPHKPSR